MKQPLTKRQAEILAFIAAFIEGHGYAPSLEEIGTAHGLTSLATVHKHLTSLQERGHITRRTFRSRSMALTVPLGYCPSCGQEMPSAKTAL